MLKSRRGSTWFPGPPRLGVPPLRGTFVAIAALATATVLAAVLEARLGVSNAAIVYLLAVVVVATVWGSWPAMWTAGASFLLYDFLFVEPRFTPFVAQPEEWLDLLLFLVVAAVIGRLSGLQSRRRREAELRSAEAQAMFALSREFATAQSALQAAPALVSRLTREAEMARVWVGLGSSISEEATIADSSPGEPRPSLATRWLLHSVPAEGQPGWVRVHDPAKSRDGREARDETWSVFRIPIEVAGETIGSLWSDRRQGDPFPGRSHTRLMAAAADQLGQSLIRDRLAAQATAAEVARQSDALKSALLDSVSHDLRTPLAGIRAAAGNLMDPDLDWSREEQRATARTIDLEAQRLTGLVRNMLDLSRIEGGALHPSLELYDLADLVDPVVQRLRPSLGLSQIEISILNDLPAVQADAIFVDQILTNLLENAGRYARGKLARVSARRRSETEIELMVEDAGTGVPIAALSHLFDRFYRAPRQSRPHAEGGAGVGLAVVKGLAEAMGGSVEARTSRLGGLAVVVRLVAQPVEAEPVDPEPVDPEPVEARPPEAAAPSRRRGSR